MSLDNLSVRHLKDVIAELDQALYNHKEWYRLLVRALVCRSPCDKHDLLPESHKICHFGRWYYNFSDENLIGHPRFIAIGKKHKHMHDLVKEVIIVANKGEVVSPQGFDSFSDSLDALQKEIDLLKQADKAMYAAKSAGRNCVKVFRAK